MIKRFLTIATLVFVMAFMCLPANAQFTQAWTGGCAPNSTAIAPMSFGIDLLTGIIYSAGNGTGFVRQDFTLGVAQGTTATAIATANFTTLTGSIGTKIPLGVANCANSHVRIRAKGVYTTAAASVLNAQVVLCTVSGCGSGTVVAPAGCSITGTNQANVLANGQWTLECDLTTVATGTSGAFMAKGLAGFNLGATASGVTLSIFPDTATAVSAAVDLTVTEYLGIQFKFTTANAGNTATLQQMTVELVN